MSFKARPEAVKETTHRLNLLEMIQEKLTLTTNPTNLATNEQKGGLLFVALGCLGWYPTIQADDVLGIPCQNANEMLRRLIQHL
jgi:hypothetical protein